MTPLFVLAFWWFWSFSSFLADFGGLQKDFTDIRLGFEGIGKGFFKSFGNICDGFVSLGKDFKDLIESFEGIWKAVKVNSKVFTNLCNAFICLEKDLRVLQKVLKIL